MSLELVPTYQYAKNLPSAKFSFADIDKLVVNLADCTKIIPTERIEFIKASGGYSIIHFIDGCNLMVCKTLKSISSSLGDHFLRTHNSYVVNLKYIKEYRAKEGKITMESSKTVQVSRINKRILNEILQSQ